jgi:hypothetical protein
VFATNRETLAICFFYLVRGDDGQLDMNVGFVEAAVPGRE